MESGDLDENDNVVSRRCISERSLAILYDMQEEGTICDAVLKTETGGYFPVHRAIMSVCSPYFRALFTTKLHSQERTEITIPGVARNVLKLIVEFAYRRHVPLTCDNVTELMVAADQFCILPLVDNCEQFLIEQLEPENCIGFRTFARFYFLKRFYQKSHEYLLSHFVEVAETSEELLSLSAEELTDILGDDELNVHGDETKVWETVLRWLDADPDDRKYFIAQLLLKVRMAFVDKHYVDQKIQRNPYVRHDNRCQSFMTDLPLCCELDWAFSDNAQVNLLEKPRVPHELIFAIGGWSGGAPTNAIEIYDSRADCWNLQMVHADPVGPRAYHGCVVIGFNIYLIGGFDGEEYFNSCRSLNVVSKTWREIAPMYTRRCYVSATVLNNKVYAMGGYDGQHRQRTAEKYDPESNQWTKISRMNARRSDACACAINQRIYIVGGFDGRECQSTVEVYNPETDQWTMISPMISRRSGVRCIAHHGHIYAVGGFNGVSRLCTVEKYNPVTDLWTLISSMDCVRSNFAIEVIDGIIYAIGGFDGTTTIANVEGYDDEFNVWYEVTEMNVFRSALCACVIKRPPNTYDFVEKNRDRVAEDKRQRARSLLQRFAEAE